MPYFVVLPLGVVVGVHRRRARRVPRHPPLPERVAARPHRRQHRPGPAARRPRAARLARPSASSSLDRRLQRRRSTSASTSASRRCSGDEMLIVAVVPLVHRRAGLVPAQDRRRHRRAGRGRERRPRPAARHPGPPAVHDRVDDRRRPGGPHLHPEGAVHRRRRPAWPANGPTVLLPAPGRRGGRPHGVAAARVRRRHRPRHHRAGRALEHARHAVADPDVVFLVVILGALLAAARQAVAGRRRAATSSWSATGVVKPIPDELRRLPEVRWAKVGARRRSSALAFVFVPATLGAEQPAPRRASPSCGRWSACRW